MPNCTKCSNTQSKLNPGDLCRNCFHDVNENTKFTDGEMFWSRMEKLVEDKLKEFEITFMVTIKPYIGENIKRHVEPFECKVKELTEIAANQQIFLEEIGG